MNQQTRLECQQLFDVYKACKKAHRERVIQERLDARGGRDLAPTPRTRAS